MKAVAPVRKELKMKTIFNILGPIVNPSNPKNQLVGVFDLKTAELYGKLFSSLDKNYAIVHTLSGYDEISLTDDFKIITKNENKIVSPQNLGFKTYEEKTLEGGKTIKEAGKIFLTIIESNGTESQNNVVLTNAAFAIQTISNKSFEESFKEAENSLFYKKAQNKFRKILEK